MNKPKSFCLTFLIFGFVYANALQLSESLHWNKVRGYAPFGYSTPQGILINNKSDSLQYNYFKLDSPSNDFSLDFRATNKHGNPMKKYVYFTPEGEKNTIRNPLWGLFITGLQDTVAFTFRSSEIADVIESIPALEIRYYNNTKSIQNINITKGIDPFDGDNIWKIKICNGNLILRGGNHFLNEIMNFELPNETVTGFGFIAGWGSCLSVSDINLTTTTEYYPTFNLLDFEKLDAYFETSEDMLEGYWNIFDRELEESLIRMGGDYELACVKEGDDYYFYYMKGASVSKSEWHPGEIKAILTPTPFEGIYDVTWFDSLKQPLSRDIKAQTGEGNTLSIQFPYQSSRLRLRKKP